jgi:methyl-accepting chemotaxis protein
MKSFFHIPVRVKYLFLFVTILLFSVISGLAFLHIENTIARVRSTETRFDAALTPVHTIDSWIMNRYLQSVPDSLDPENRDAIDTVNMLFEQLATELEETRPALTEMAVPEVDALLDTLMNLTAKWRAATIDVISLHAAGPASREYLVLHRYTDQINSTSGILKSRLREASATFRSTLKTSLIFIVGVSISIVLLVVIIIALYMERNLKRILVFTRILEKGGQPEPLQIHSGDEFQEIAEGMNNYLQLKKEKYDFLKTVGQGNDIGTFEPKKDDVFGKELAIMAERLIQLRNEEQKRMEVENRSRWISEGIAQFAEILRSEREDVTELAFRIIQELVKYLSIEMGSLFVTTENESGEEVLEAVAAYAYDRRKYPDAVFRMGDGLPGTCALEKEKIYIDDIPEDYSDIISGVGQTKPKYVLLVPLKIDQQIFGVLELASLHKLEQHQQDLVEKLAESIATTLSAVKTNERTSRLLEQSQQQAELLLKQEETMRKSLQELENANLELRRKESEITGIINAMNQSSLVAEFSLNGRFININERFLELLESPREQVMGKHHSEFAVVDKYSDDYKALWTALKKGESISRQEKFKLYSGKELWLQQTFSPIFRDEETVHKIQLIAIDVSHSKQQQEHLESQAAEITRKNLEMHSLNEAVDSAIIKCELDHEGVILDANSNFTAVTGYTRKELIGRNYRRFLKDVEKEQFEKIWTEITKDKSYEGAIRRTRPTGEEVWLMASFSPVKDESGVIYKIYFLALDMTEKKLKYQLLEDANREIDRLKEMLKKYEG